MSDLLAAYGRAPSAHLLARSEPFPATDRRARPAPSLNRKYEITCLVADLSLRHHTHVAPAIPAFEEATSAFARGTLIQTVSGPVAIEDLLPGDYIETTTGPAPVMWIGSTTYVPSVENDETGLTSLLRMTSDAMGRAQPETDLLLGPGARMVLHRDRLKTLIGQSRVLVPVADYVDEDRIVSLTPAGAVQLYHLALKTHSTFRVNGLEMESYHPGASLRRQLGDALCEKLLGFFPHIESFSDFGELTLPRSSREVIDSLTAR
ncbi:Hint domain-containing protein [Litorisediminicola beolgyonensis]|uniref:Hint domain-containing protein n=1 Tax=Litorisediminicola beolgyonensis TaxID=1173614 RepID=A0ABW3ZEU8_9RHOB